MTAATTPATDEQIAHYERTIGSFVMTAQSYDHVIRSLIARIHQEREKTGWQPIETAPKDGTRVLIWFVHESAKYSKDPIAEGWAAAHEAHWIDHNKGGWTWYGLCGVATHWQPLPTPPALSQEERS